MLDFLKKKVVEIVVGFVVTMLLGSGVSTLGAVRDEIKHVGLMLAVQVEKVRVAEDEIRDGKRRDEAMYDKLHGLELEFAKVREAHQRPKR